MTTEKRGSEKLFNTENGLCSLTAEELAQVAGGALPVNLMQLHGYFPLGTLPDDIFSKLKISDRLDRPAALINELNIPIGKSVSNGF